MLLIASVYVFARAMPPIANALCAQLTCTLLHSTCCLLAHAPGRWNVLFAGLLLLAFATALYGLSTSVGSLILASTLHGTSLSFIHVSSLALLSAFPLRSVVLSVCTHKPAALYC
jgi:hypothetical protein